MTHASVIKWLRKFVDIVKPYVDSMSPPRLSGVYHVDEMMIHAERERMEVGHYEWLWNLINDTTRFWISSMVSQRREDADARRVFRIQKIRQIIRKQLSTTATKHFKKNISA